jgi:N-methylhydantoinase B
MNGTDGYDHIGMIDASGGVLDQDYEMFEQQTPHLLIKHEYLPDSAGAGHWRGGLGVETRIRLRGEGTQLVTFGDGDVEPAFGVFGGGQGTLNYIELRHPDGEDYRCTSKDLVTGVPNGTLYIQEAGGGGGYGDPHERPVGKVLEEVRNGIVSVEKARELYGVVVDAQTMTLDEAATARLRSGG